MRILLVVLLILALAVALLYPVLRARLGRSGPQTQVTDRDERPPAHPGGRDEVRPGSQPDRERKGRP